MQRLSSALDDLERRGVLIPERSAVTKYLQAHPNLLSVVERVSERALARFGDRAELSLEIYRDPEINDRHLALYARQSPYEPGFFDEIRNVMDEHWSLLPSTSGFFYLTTDYKHPHRQRHGV